VLAIACGDDGGGDATATSGGSTEPGESSHSTSLESGSTSDDAGSTTADSTSETGEPLPECPEFAAGEMVGTVMQADLVEASGLVASRMYEDVLWTHNDSGGDARVFAITTAGAPLATFEIEGAPTFDWEDLAIGPGPAQVTDWLYIGDIGDNAEVRTSIDVYRIAEPDPGLGDATITDVATLTLAYPDGPHNAETLLSDPRSGDLYVVTKTESGSSGVFRAAFPHDEGATIELEAVATIALPSGARGSTLATGGDISAAGDLVAIRTYANAWAWRRGSDATIAEAFETEPCPLPTVSEPQGETLAFGAAGYYTISEGAARPIWFFAGP
jgi:hypothetical protein